ncbi:MAG: methionine adenosyltransferase, partial [Clostridia bacterium]|nr:methionine adenosyltransferase [Clostridia bacterium]
MRKFFTSESVSCGHPDKLCDRISDAILDEYLKKDPTARVACECSATKNFLLIMGEITSCEQVDVKEVAKRVIKETGYDYKGSAFSSDNVEIVVKINRQSPDIALGVDNSLEFKSESADRFDKIGAGDQGIMFGYAVRETEELMPLPITLAHKMCEKLEEVRVSGELPYLRPDGKGQITVEY